MGGRQKHFPHRNVVDEYAPPLPPRAIEAASDLILIEHAAEEANRDLVPTSRPPSHTSDGNHAG